jgi:Tol biopolymer transport system component
MTTSTSLKSPQTDENARWIQRFRTPVVLWSELAKANPKRGIISGNESGIFQLYAWDVATNERQQLTDHADGKAFGTISPDGRYIYYLEDEGGNEIGHFVRVPFEGGEPENITPDMPPYSSLFLDLNHTNTRLGLTAATPEGFHIYVASLDPSGKIGALQGLHKSDKLMFGPLLSYDGDIGIVQTTERTSNINFSLIAFDIASGEQIGELWEGTENSLEFAKFCPLSGDTRLLASSNQTGDKRPLIWNPRTG